MRLFLPLFSTFPWSMIIFPHKLPFSVSLLSIQPLFPLGFSRLSVPCSFHQQLLKLFHFVPQYQMLLPIYMYMDCILSLLLARAAW